MFRPEFHFNTLLFTLPQMLLMLYVLYLRNSNDPAVYGIAPPTASILPSTVLTFFLILGVNVALSLLSELAEGFFPVDFVNPAFPGSLPQDFSLFDPPFLLLLILLTSISIGYFEELFFRVYLLEEFSQLKHGPHFAVFLSGLLFAGGHFYQGIIGGIGTFLIGILLGYRYLRSRSWHEISIAHGLYNFTIILLIPIGI